MTLMFNKQQVEEATHPLARILRKIFYDRRITNDDFSAMYARLGKQQGLAPHVNNTNKNNARKALNYPDSITFVLFRYILYNVLYADIVEFSVTIRDEKTGKLITYKNTDPVE